MSKGQVAIVTGGSRGIGLATARLLREQGWRVAITATGGASLGEAVRGFGGDGAGGELMPIVADVRDAAAVDAAVTAVVERFGGVDLLVNNAGIGTFGRVDALSLEQWHAVIGTNLTGVFHTCRAVLPHLRARGGGWIVNVSSLASTSPFPDGAAYCASKAALNAFTESLMQEVRQDGIRVACVLPGSVRTGFMGRTPGPQDEWKLAPEDVARAIADLVAHPGRSLPSRIEIRPARPPRKG